MERRADMEGKNRRIHIVEDGPPLDEADAIQVLLYYITGGDVDGYLRRLELRILKKREEGVHI